VAKHKLGQLKGGALKPDIARSYVQGVGALSKAVGYRCEGNPSCQLLVLIPKYLNLH
jgi:hypothetical protein